MLSSDRLRASELPRELEAALVGDFDRLKSGSADAQHFAEAFTSRAGQPWWEESDPAGPLGLAAKAISSERRGESETALDLYAHLSGDKAAWFRLVGLLLQGWSFLVEDVQPVLIAADEVRCLRKSQRKARLLAKLSIFASDKGRIDIAHALWQDAVCASDAKTHLGRALRIEAINLGIAHPDYELLSTSNQGPVDSLVYPESIEQLRLASATGTFVQSAEERFKGAWSHTVRMGATPLDDLVSAEAQARWIGLPWMCRAIRKEFGAQLLSGAASDAHGWAQGVVMWALGGGRHPNQALQYAEPHFDKDSADYVVRSVGDCDPTRGRLHRWAALGAEAWDLISDATLQLLAEGLPPRRGLGSPAEESRRIWAAFAIRLPDAWYKRYLQLDADTQGSLFDSLEPSAVRYFDNEMRATMYAALGDNEQVLEDGGRLLPFAAALAPKEDDDRLRLLVDSGCPLSSRVVAQLLKDRPAVISAAAEARFLTKLQSSVEEQSAEARKGKISLGSAGPRLELGRMLSSARSSHPEMIDLLVNTATDSTLPPQYLMDARQGLLVLRRHGKLRRTDLAKLRSAPIPPKRGPLAEGITPDVLRVLVLQIVAEKTTASERLELVSAVRSQEERVRDLAVNACAEALQVSRDEGLAWAVVSGMFDPSASVSDGALAGLLPLTEHHRHAAEVAWQRLPDLYVSSPKKVRIQIINALDHVPARTRRQRERKASLLAHARQDRSWQIREAAAEIKSEH